MALNCFDWVKMSRRKRVQLFCKKESKSIQNPFLFPEILDKLLTFVDFETVKNLRQLSTDLNDLATKWTLKVNYLSLRPLDDSIWSGVQNELSLLHLTFQHGGPGKVFSNLKIPLSLLNQQIDLTEQIMTKLPDLDLFDLFGSVTKLRICVDDPSWSVSSDDSSRVFQLVQQLPKIESIHLPNFGYIFDPDPGQQDEVNQDDLLVTNILEVIHSLFLDRVDDALAKLVISGSLISGPNGRHGNHQLKIPESIRKLTILQNFDLTTQIEDDQLCWPLLENYCLKNCQWTLTSMTLSVEPEMDTQVIRQFLTNLSQTLTTLQLSFANGGQHDDLPGVIPNSLKKLTNLTLTCWYDGWSPKPLFCSLAGAIKLPKLTQMTLHQISPLEDLTWFNKGQNRSASLKILILDTTNCQLVSSPMVNLWPNLSSLNLTKATRQLVILILRNFSTKIKLEELTLNLKNYDDDGQLTNEDWDCVLTGVRRVFNFDNRFSQNLPAKKIETCRRRSIRHFKDLKKLHITNKECDPLTNHFVYHGLIHLENLTSVIIEGAVVTPKAASDVRQSLRSAGVIQIDHENGVSCCEAGCDETCVEWTQFPAKPCLSNMAGFWPVPKSDDDDDDTGGREKKNWQTAQKRKTARQKRRTKLINKNGQDESTNFIRKSRNKRKINRKRLKSNNNYFDNY